MSNRDMHVSCVVERDEDGVWSLMLSSGRGTGAHGEGDTPEAAADDLREALTGLVAEFGVPEELTLTVDAA